MSRTKKGNNVQLKKGVAGSFSLDFNELLDIKKNTKKYGKQTYWESSEYNTRLFLMFRAEILAMALNRFKWINLPPTCDERYLELTLILQGQASLAYPKQKKGVWFSTQLAQVSRPNIYDNPTHWRAIGNNGFRFDADWSNGVVVWDNRMRYPLLEKINIWAQELADIVRVKQINRQHQKVPYVFSVPQEMVGQAENLYKQVSGNEPAIIGTTGMETIKPEVWSTGVEFIGEKLNAEMQNIWAEVYLALGISNQTFKAERMIEDEIRSQAEPTEMVKLDSLSCRREACKKMNERFKELLPNGDIDVVWNYDSLSDNYDFMHNIEKQIEALNDVELGE